MKKYFGLSNKLTGLFLSLITSTALLFAFYGNILSAPNKALFATSGDGLKSTFNSYYHLQYDSTYWHTQSMNYPYGESVMYSGGQPLLINVLKLSAYFGVDLSGEMGGILNVFLLFTIVLAVVLLYLVLVNLKLPWHYSIVVANIIVFLSPQINRFSGHYNLSYLFFLPLFLYLLQKFFEKPSYKLSLLLAAVNFSALCVQAYFFAMFAFWLFFLLIFGYANNKEKLNKIRVNLFHLSIQIILPFLLFSLITLPYSDYRTEYPWGFFYTRAHPESVFLPIGKPYGQWFKFSYVRWSGIAYLGLTTSIGFFVLLFNYFKKKKNSLPQWLSFTNVHYLDAIFWGSFVALLVSFAYPFTWNLEWLLNYTGPFKQFRASGRFAWLFYFTLNIVVYYFVWQLFMQKRKYVSILVLLAAVSFGMYDAYLNVCGKEEILNNSIEALEDVDNLAENNRWINQINTEEFQSILPMPFFHIGSEVYWIDAPDETVKNTFIVSWKTGLPISATMLSRSSIPQTMKLLEYYFEPIEQKSILNDLPNTKDFLLLYSLDESLTKVEQLYKKYAIPIAQNNSYEVLSLPIDSIKQMTIDYQEELTHEFEKLGIPINTFWKSDSNKPFKHFAKTEPLVNLELDDGFSFLAKEKSTLCTDMLFETTDTVLISFWMSDMNKDLIPRAELKLETQNKVGEWSRKISTSLFKKVKYVNENGWGLVEFSYKPAIPNEPFRVQLKNSLTTNESFLVNHILVRPKSQNVYYRTENKRYKNNRIINSSK